MEHAQGDRVRETILMRQIELLAVLAVLSGSEMCRAEDPNDRLRLGSYRADQAARAGAATVESRVIFVGDSIVERWSRFGPELFADRSLVNRGISGQTTSQMLKRFRADVVAVQPRVVVILAGTNDIAGNAGPISEPEIMENIASMAELARSHGIRVVLISVLPVHRYYWNPRARPAARIVELNRLIAAYAKQHGHGWVDLHALLADANQGLKREYGDDGVHPNRAAYRVMRAPVEEAIVAASR